PLAAAQPVVLARPDPGALRRPQLVPGPARAATRSPHWAGTGTGLQRDPAAERATLAAGAGSGQQPDAASGADQRLPPAACHPRGSAAAAPGALLARGLARARSLVGADPSAHAAIAGGWQSENPAMGGAAAARASRTGATGGSAAASFQSAA